MLAAMQTSNRALRTSVESKISNLREDNSKLQSSVESKFACRIKLQEAVRADIKPENEKLIRRLQTENQNLSKELSERLYSEAQAVSCWLPTAAAQVRFRAEHVGFMVDKAALGQVFSQYFGFPC
jgi:hypothetical protein